MAAFIQSSAEYCDGVHNIYTITLNLRSVNALPYWHCYCQSSPPMTANIPQHKTVRAINRLRAGLVLGWAGGRDDCVHPKFMKRSFFISFLKWGNGLQAFTWVTSNKEREGGESEREGRGRDNRKRERQTQREWDRGKLRDRSGRKRKAEKETRKRGWENRARERKGRERARERGQRECQEKSWILEDCIESHWGQNSKKKYALKYIFILWAMRFAVTSSGSLFKFTWHRWVIQVIYRVTWPHQLVQDTTKSTLQAYIQYSPRRTHHK